MHGKTSERWSGAHRGFSERTDTTLKRIERHKSKTLQHTGVCVHVCVCVGGGGGGGVGCMCVGCCALSSLCVHPYLKDAKHPDLVMCLLLCFYMDE